MLKAIPLGTSEHITDAEQVSFKKWGSIWIICQTTDKKKLFLTPAGMSDYFDNKLKQAWKLEITWIKLSPVNDWAPPSFQYIFFCISHKHELFINRNWLIATGHKGNLLDVWH